jgi:putative ABC transport system permease protein
MSLIAKLVFNDLKKNKVITIALTIFLFISALFMAGGLRILGTAITSEEALASHAILPDFIQMHKGDYNKEKFEQFVAEHSYIKDAIVVAMLDIKNTSILYEGEDLGNCLMDNGFVTQNEGFDYLLDRSNEVAKVQTGEIGVPVYYAREYGMQVGDTITIHEGDFRKKLRIATIIRDGTMNTALASSKRFLIHESDLQEIAAVTGEWEYCFEFLLQEGTNTATLEKDYVDEGMPKNGVAVTSSLLKLLDTFSHGLVALIVIAVSILLVLMAILCLSYIIKATLLEESPTLGEMRAIGLSKKKIIGLYQYKYSFLMILSSIFAYIFAIPFANIFTESVVDYCGKGSAVWMQWVFPVIGLFVLIVIVIWKSKRIIQKQMKGSIVELRQGVVSRGNDGHYKLPSKGLSHKNLQIALGELRCKWKEYVVLFFVFLFASFIILLPINIKNTLNNPSFITYMGVGKSDLRIDIPYSDHLQEEKQKVEEYLKSDNSISKYQMTANGYVQMKNTEGEWEYIRVMNEETNKFPLEYLEGNAPVQDNEMAISSLNAKSFGKKIGDFIEVKYQNEIKEYTITGIYQDITYGGKTAKAHISFKESDLEGYIIYLDVNKGIQIEGKEKELRTIFTGCRVTPVKEFITQTLGGVTESMGLVSVSAIAIAIFLIFAITIMFLQLIMAREHSAIAIKKALGFSNKDLQVQLVIRVLVIQILAIVLGTILANTLGETVLGLMLSSMGVSKITLLIKPIASYIISPIAQLVMGIATVIVSSKGVKRYHIRNQIME